MKPERSRELLEELRSAVDTQDSAALAALEAFALHLPVGSMPDRQPIPARVPEEGELAGWIDHTALGPDVTVEVVDRLCDEARQHRFASVCVNGFWVAHCAKRLEGSAVVVCCVVGFPLGAGRPDVKAYEALRAIDDGASEIDMVLNIGALKAGGEALVEEDIRCVVRVAHQRNVRVKVILETCLLTDGQKVSACRIARRAGADFVKTSTGFSSAGATASDVAMMRSAVGEDMGVKASGGIRDGKTARAMLEAGATRIGASASIQIVQG